MKIYVSGGISGILNYKAKFKKAEKKLINMGHAVINPAILPTGLQYDDYMHISYAMIDCCDGLYILPGWKDSKGANLEMEYAIKHDKRIYFEEGKNAN